MKVGVTLPQFGDEADAALAAARRAEELGLDGVFCFDHLWPMGRPGRPALSPEPLLGAMAASTIDHASVPWWPGSACSPTRCWSRGYQPLDHQRRPVHRRPGHRRPPQPGREPGLRRPLRARRRSPGPPGRGGRHGPSPGDPGVGRRRGGRRRSSWPGRLGAAVNLWGAEPGAGGRARRVRPGGHLGRTVDTHRGRGGRPPQRLADAGATWAVCAWPDSLEVVAEAAAAVRGRT